MEFSFGITSFLASLLLLFLCFTPSYATLSVKVTSEELNSICSKTQNPSLCLGALKSNPGTATADLPGLARISITLARANATDTINLIQSLIQKTTNPQLKQKYTSCSEHYDDAIADLDMAKQSLSAGDPSVVSTAASGALDEADDCEEEIKGSPADPSGLSQRSENLKGLCSTILVISNLLPQSN